nr:hypothetical protein [Tanacetum cinerariifolium]
KRCGKGVRQSSSRAAAPVSAAMPINTAASKPLENVAKPRQNALQKSHSLSRRSLYQQTTLKSINLNNNKANYVNTSMGNKITSAVGNQEINAVKSSACLVSNSDEDESEDMVLKSDNVQHKPKQATQPRKVSQNLGKNRTSWNEMRTQKLGVRNFAPTIVLTKSRIVLISTARQSSSRAAAPVSAAMPINTAASKPLENVAKPRQNALQKSHSLSRRS